jgi:hypothetical protein
MDIEKLIAGDSLNFATCVPGYSAADGWTLRYRLVPMSGAGGAIDLVATADGDSHRVQASAAVTANWPAGVYSWASWVDKAGERYTNQTGQLTVTADPRTATAGWDNRSAWRKALDDAKAALQAWTPTRRRYKIGEREMEFNTSADIIKHIKFLEGQVLQEDINAGRATAPARRIYTRI